MQAKFKGFSRSSKIPPCCFEGQAYKKILIYTIISALEILDWVNGEISTENYHDINVPLFDAAYAASNKGTSILYLLWSPLTSLTKHSKIQGFLEAVDRFSNTFQGRFSIFKDF